ncbi:MAG TPA: squalene/phytoene synthase family protein [Segetibacter sp.]|nr:squalene/phytoene synthase family protein [Segetibacter sp.]
MMHLFSEVGYLCSKITTEKYSTSFSSSIRLLHRDLRTPVYNIYGFVRFADEIVDTFHDYEQEVLLEEFKVQTYEAIERKISLNPILNSFQETVNKYGIPTHFIDVFFRSMEQDLYKLEYDKQAYNDYIYGSAEVVGLMCLYVFCEGDVKEYEALKPFAQSLGAAFQKVNFLRDLKADTQTLERMYFPGCNFLAFSEDEKQQIELDILKDFQHAYCGIIRLPIKARFGVYVAYKYYLSLFAKIRKTKAKRIMEERIRIPNYGKAMILAKAGVRSQLNML